MSTSHVTTPTINYDRLLGQIGDIDLHTGPEGHTYDVLAASHQAIEDLRAQLADPWTSVDDSMPQEGQPLVLVVRPEPYTGVIEQMLGFHRVTSWYEATCAGTFQIKGTVTHWTPQLPWPSK